MSQLTTNTTTIDELITLANNLPDASSGGEDVSAETAEYTGLLDDLETAIDALPDAGGGGSGTVETCTVNVSCTYWQYASGEDIVYSGVENNQIVKKVVETVSGSNTAYELEVVKNSIIAINGLSSSLDWTPNGVYEMWLGGVGRSFFFITGDGHIAGNPCFAYGTLILLANGTSKPVQDIEYSDELLVWDFDNGCNTKAKPIWIKQEQTIEYYWRCLFEDGIVLKLVGPESHRVFSIDDNSFEYAINCVNKMVQTINGPKKLISCERIEEEVKFYNIITHTHLNLYAENVLTSCRLNNIYPIENMKFVKETRVKKNREDYPNIGSDMFRGLRIAEQTMSKEEIDEYVARLYALMDHKMKCYLFINNQAIVMDEKEYYEHFGETDIRQYVSDLYHSRIVAEDVPEEYRQRAVTAANKRIARFGTPGDIEISDTEALNILTGGDLS